jgi:hypothetical protein
MNCILGLALVAVAGYVGYRLGYIVGYEEAVRGKPARYRYSHG